AATVEVSLTPEEQERLSSLSARYDELVSALEDGDASAELDRISAEMEALEAKQVGWASEEKARAGAILCLGPDGEVEVHRGLLKREAASVESDDEPKQEKRSGNGNGYAESVLLDLSVHRTAALRAVVSENPELAMTALLHALVGNLLYDGRAETC